MEISVVSVVLESGVGMRIKSCFRVGPFWCWIFAPVTHDLCPVS